MSEHLYTTADLAAELGVASKTVRRRAAELGLGMNVSGRAGYRYSAADRQALHDSMRTPVEVKPRRKRRAA